MACNTCKQSNPTFVVTSDEKVSNLKNIKHYFFKFLVFLLVSAILIPFIIPILLYTLFITIVLSKGVDIMPLLLHLGKKIFPDEKEEDEEEEINDDEYELENVHDVVVLN